MVVITRATRFVFIERHKKSCFPASSEPKILVDRLSCLAAIFIARWSGEFSSLSYSNSLDDLDLSRLSGWIHLQTRVLRHPTEVDFFVLQLPLCLTVMMIGFCCDDLSLSSSPCVARLGDSNGKINTAPRLPFRQTTKQKNKNQIQWHHPIGSDCLRWLHFDIGKGHWMDPIHLYWS